MQGKIVRILSIVLFFNYLYDNLDKFLASHIETNLYLLISTFHLTKRSICFITQQVHLQQQK